MQVSEHEILTIYRKGYSALTSLHGALYQARRDFFRDGVHKKGRISDQEDGMQVQLRYAISGGSFVWEKHSDRRLTERASSIPGGWALSFYNENGGVRSRTEYDGEHHLRRAEYFAPGGEVQESLSIIAEHPDELVWTRRQANGEQTETVLRACPVQMGTAEQAMIDSEAGEPQILAARLDGDFCYCTEEEYCRRGELRERLGSGAISTIPVFVPDKPLPEPADAQEEERAQEEALPPVLPQPQEIAVSDLMEQIQKMEEKLGMVRGRLCAEPEKMQNFPKKESTQPDVPKLAGEPRSEPPGGRAAARYTVAKRGADGAVRAPGLCSGVHPVPPEAAEEIPRAVQSIVISQTERYRYFGEVLDGLRHGRGRTEMPDGKTAYEGTYSRGRRDGLGAYYYKTGRLCYAGAWRNDRREGAGVGFRPDGGSLYAGTWRNDRPGGSGAVIGPDGSVCYAGAIENGRRHGVGASFHAKDGALLVARWQNGIPCGGVTLFDAEGRIRYTGRWQNGERHGMGTSYSADGQIEFTGQWQNGEPVSGIYYENGLPARALSPEKYQESDGKKKDRKM